MKYIYISIYMMEKFRRIIYGSAPCLIPTYAKLRVQNKTLTKIN